MKNTLLIVLILSCFVLRSQTTNRTVKTKPVQTQKKYSPASAHTVVNTLKHDTCLNKKFSIVFYVIQDSLFSLPNNTLNTTNNIASYSLTTIINLLNTTFSRICVSFENCKTVIIPNYEHNRWKWPSNGAMILSTWYTDNTINVYIPDQIDQTYLDAPEPVYAGTPIGYTGTPSATMVPKNAIVLYKGAVTQMNGVYFKGSSILHAFGHFFGLPHTFDEISPLNIPNPAPPNNCTPPITTLEYADHVSIQNCRDHGDGFCDTEADPYPSYLTVPSPIPTGMWGCSDLGGVKDGYGTPYLPPSDNFMSHYGCRCKFTQEQYNYMAYIIMTKRLYLH